jgi:hypothetical protein
VVDLKDKWRNLEATGRVLRDRGAQLRAVGLEPGFEGARPLREDDGLDWMGPVE